MADCLLLVQEVPQPEPHADAASQHKAEQDYSDQRDGQWDATCKTFNLVGVATCCGRVGSLLSARWPGIGSGMLLDVSLATCKLLCGHWGPKQVLRHILRNCTGRRQDAQ